MLRLCYDSRSHRQRQDEPLRATPGKRTRTRLLASSAALVAVPVAALAMLGAHGGTTRFSATELSTQGQSTSGVRVVTGREPVPEPQTLAVPKGVAVVAPPTTTTTTAPPVPVTAAPEAAPAPTAPPTTAPDPVEVPVPDPVTVHTPPPPAPRPAPRPAPADGSVSANLDAIAQCESGGNPDAYNPAGYYGAFQFALDTWHGLGLTGDPRDYRYNQQKFGALALYNRSGYAPWPSCSRQLGLL